MNPNESRISRPLILLGLLVVVILSTSVIPAKWFGVEIKPQKSTRLDLASIIAQSRASEDLNKNNIPDWKDLLQNTLSVSSDVYSAVQNYTVTEEDRALLNDPNNLTSSFSKNLYTTSAYLTKAGITDETSQQEAVKKLIAEEKEKLGEDIYSFSDINVSAKETADSIKIYGNTIAPILKDVVTEKTIIDDLTSINTFVQTGNTSNLNIITKNKDRVDEVLKKLLFVSIPPSASLYHLLAVNRVAAYRNTLSDLTKIETDPVRSTVALKQYVEVVTLVLKLQNKFHEYFNTKNINFSSKEAGYVFEVGYTIK